MMVVDNKKVIRRLAHSSFRAARTRNIIATAAIALTALLFTSLFTMGFGAVESMERSAMVMSGGDGHAAIKYVTDEEFAAVSAHPLVKEMAYTRILSDGVDNTALAKRITEFWYYDDLGLKFCFVEPTAGRRPQAVNEVIADTKTLELLGVPLEEGAPLRLELDIRGKKVTRDFVLSGWWESDPGFNIGQISASRAYLDAYADELYNSYYQDHFRTGAINGHIKFASSVNIEETLERVLTESGFSLEEGAPNHMATGVNWAYMSTGIELDVGTRVALASALLLFVFTGYLIIYNIFQISVLRDIRFYGLLKTIGATGRQLRAVIGWQALVLSAVGIPLGLLAGFFVGKGLVPALIAQSSFSGSRAVVSPNPLIFAGAAVFSLITVFISTRRPGAMAARVSPVEAVHYTDADASYNRARKHTRDGGRPQKMALTNLGRNRRRTLLAVLSLTLSIVLTNTVFTFSQSVDLDKALERFGDSDFLLGHADLFYLRYSGQDSALSESFVAAAEGVEGFEEGGRLYAGWGSYTSPTTRQPFNRQPDGAFSTSVYGLDPFPLSRLGLVAGELDTEKLATGDYVLEGIIPDDHGRADVGKANHRVGERITLSVGDSRREMTVLGQVIIKPGANTDGMWLGSAFFLPGEVYRDLTGQSFAMSYAFNVAQEQEEDVERFLQSYTGLTEPTMHHRSKFTALAGLEGVQRTAVLVGGSLSLIIGLIGILNFINAILTGILTRQKEFAMLQSIGMTRRQLVGMLCWEGVCYAALTSAAALVLSIGSSLLIVRPMGEQIWFLRYHFVYWPLAVLLPLLFLLGALLPYLLYRAATQQSIVERLRVAG